MAKVKTSLVVKPHRPWRLWLLLALLPFLLAAVAKSALEYGRVEAGREFSGVEARNAELVAGLAAAKQENRQLRERTVVLERSVQVDRQAHEEVRRNLGQLQSEIAELTGELAFYRSIVAPEEAKPGLRVQDLRIIPGGERLFRYRLVLTQLLNHDRKAEGRLVLTVEGFEEGEAERYRFGDLGDEERPRFAFKYFQNIEGDIRLPEGFSPSRVVVEVKPKGKRAKSFSRHFDWPVALSSHLSPTLSPTLPSSAGRVDG